MKLTSLMGAPFAMVGSRPLDIANEMGADPHGRHIPAATSSRCALTAQSSCETLYSVGVKSFPIILITGLFVGAIMVMQSELYVEKYGAEGPIGWGADFATPREVSPMMIALMFNGRVGAKSTAEIGVTEQADALRTLAIDPISYLIMPRFISMVVMMSLVVVVVVDATARWLVPSPHSSSSASTSDSLTTSPSMSSFMDVYTAITFLRHRRRHHLLPLGITVSGGASAVERAVNDSVVASAIGVFSLNYLVTYLTI